MTGAELDALERAYADYRRSLADVNAVPADMVKATLLPRVWNALPALLALARDGLKYRGTWEAEFDDAATDSGDGGEHE